MLPYSKHFITFATAIGKQGTLTEWLGSGLQNRARQFDSARYLKPIRCKTLESSTLQRMFFWAVYTLGDFIEPVDFRVFKIGDGPRTFRCLELECSGRVISHRHCY